MSLILRRAPAFASARNLNDWMDDAFSAWPFGGGSAAATASWIPAVDVFEDANAIRVVAELPGLKPEDVQITLEDGTLTIRGEKKQGAEETTERVHRYERSYGVFQRAFRLPDSVDGDRVDAAYENGVLTVTLPKAERAKPRKIQVSVK